MKRLISLVLLALLLAPVGIAAQDATDDCPAGYACVPYSGTTVEINRKHGAACFVTAIAETTTTTLDGSTMTKTASCTLFVEVKGEYEIAAEGVRLTPEQAAVAEIGEPLVLRMDS